MRTLHVAPFLWTLGERQGMPSVFLGLKGFVDAGHSVDLILAGKEYNSFAYEGMTLHTFPDPIEQQSSRSKLVRFVRHKADTLRFIARSTRLALKVAAGLRPNLVYGHTFYGAYGAWWTARRYRVPYVYRGYGTFLLSDIGRPLRILRRPEEWLGVRLPARYWILTNDGTGYDRVAEALRLPPHRVCFWMNGVDKSLYCEHPDREAFLQTYVLPPNARVVLALSRLEGWKRVDRLIQTLPDVVAAEPETYAVIVGDGPERRRLETMAQELGVAEHVRFAGAVPRIRLAEVLNNADVFASLYDVSNIGNPLLEAMVCGRPIVTLDTGDTRQVIRDGVNGLLLAPDEPSRLTDALLNLIRSPQTRSRLGQAAREYALTQLSSWEERINREVWLMETLVNHKDETLKV